MTQAERSAVLEILKDAEKRTAKALAKVKKGEGVNPRFMAIAATEIDKGFAMARAALPKVK